MDSELDLRELKCPMPILQTKKALAKMHSGAIIKVLATDAGVPADFVAFCKHTGHQLLESSESEGVFTLIVKRK